MSSVHLTTVYHHCLCEDCGQAFTVVGECYKCQPEPYCPECAFEHSLRSYQLLGYPLPSYVPGAA